MGYTIQIGEAEIERSDEYVTIGAKLEKHDDAPAHGDPTDYENQRWPSYSAWADAMRTLGLSDVMFEKRRAKDGCDENWSDEPPCGPLMVDHPGAAGITRQHVEEVERRLREYRRKHPTHRAEYPPPREGAKPILGNMYRNEDYVKDPEFDSALCRGEWLEYWLRWAIDNCENPVFVNS